MIEKFDEVYKRVMVRGEDDIQNEVRIHDGIAGGTTQGGIKYLTEIKDGEFPWVVYRQSENLMYHGSDKVRFESKIKHILESIERAGI